MLSCGVADVGLSGFGSDLLQARIWQRLWRYPAPRNRLPDRECKAQLAAVCGGAAAAACDRARRGLSVTGQR